MQTSSSHGDNYACKNIHNLQFLMMQDSPAILTFQPGRSGHTIRNPNFAGSISEDSILRLRVTVEISVFRRSIASDCEAGPHAAQLLHRGG